MSPHPASSREQRTKLMTALKSLAEAPAPLPVEKIHQFITLENQLYPLLSQNLHWFFTQAEGTDAIQFARDMHVLHSFTAKTLEQLVARRSEWSPSEDDLLLHKVIAYALFHYSATIKWCFFRHEPVKPSVWPELHNLFQFAEAHHFAAQRVLLFDNEARYKTSVQSLYLRALLLDILNTGSLSMVQIEVADGWLADWTLDYILDTTYVPASHALMVDLASSAGMRLVTDGRSEITHRYLRIDNLREQMEALRAELRSGNTRQWRGTANAFSVEEHVVLLATIERLYQTLLQASASRIEQRNTVSNLLATVYTGYSGILQAITAPAPASPEPAPLSTDSDNSFDLLLPDLRYNPTSNDATSNHSADITPPTAARWQIHDTSSKGLALLVDQKVVNNLKVGQVLAVKPDGFEHWMMGVIVRKLVQRDHLETLLGVEILSFRPLPINLERYARPIDDSPDIDSAPIQAIYLPAPEDDGKSDMLVLPIGDFGRKTVFALKTQHGIFRIRLNRVLRKGPDWVGLRFEVIEKIDAVS
ncbi:MAG: hypothetical protein JNM52_06040 [Betaproteobacteria bacterium]|nr:hypothetical protein [Betaproteobacteria bacterium]